MIRKVVNIESAGWNVVHESGSSHCKMKWILHNSSSSLVAGTLPFLLHRKALKNKII